MQKNFLFQQKSLKKVIAINRLAVLGKRGDACKDLFPEVCMQCNSISVVNLVCWTFLRRMSVLQVAMQSEGYNLKS